MSEYPLQRTLSGLQRRRRCGGYSSTDGNTGPIRRSDGPQTAVQAACLPSVDSGPKILDDMAYEFRAVSRKEDVAICSSIDYK